MTDTQTSRVRLGVFEVDLRGGELREGDRVVRLQEQPFQILVMLISAGGQLVSREEIRNTLWPNDTIVEFDHGINTAIKKLRQALGDSADEPRYVETVARRGYRLLVAVERMPASAGDALAAGDVDVATGALSHSGVDSSELIGKKVSHYRVLRVIGGGGMGLVYEAEDLKLGRRVALKFLPGELARHPIALQRFEREARTASSLDHPNICTIHEVEEVEQKPFIVMQLLHGVTLRDRLGTLAATHARLSLEEVLNIAIQTCEGLQAAHEKGIIHRDIKPANIFLTTSGPVKILDFGLAKLVDTGKEAEGDLSQLEGGAAAALQPATPSFDTTLTSFGVAIGTAGYMSPEQVRGEKLDLRSDIFSFGLVLYEMAAGQRAFNADTVADVHHAILTATPADVLRLHPELPPRLEQIITKCLHKDRAHRYQHALELSEDLRQLHKQSSADSGMVAVGSPRAAPSLGASKHAVVRMAATALVVIALIAAAAVAYRHWHNPSVVEANASIAVLPFADMSSGKDEEYFSDGLTEQLINNLARIPGLNVVARSSSFQFKGKSEDPRNIGRKLNVANILEGSVSREGNRVRITAELIKASDGYQLWSHSYDRQINDIFAVQDEIARAVAGELQVKLTTANGERLPPSATTTPEAYASFLQARFFARRHNRGDMDKAVAYADEAIRLDATYAPSWALRSRIISELSMEGALDNTDGYRRAHEDAKTAVSLGPTLADGYIALGIIQLEHDWDWAAAEANLRKAMQVEPGNSSIYLNLAALAERSGRFDEAMELEKKSIALDPERLRGYRTLGSTYYNAGRYSEAEAALHKAIELNPQTVLARYYLGAVLLAQGYPDKALAEMQLEAFEPFRLMGEAIAQYAAGRHRESDAALNELISKHEKDSAYQVADVYAYRNEVDKAFVWLDRAYQQRDGALPNMKIDPLLKNLRNDPRYGEMLNKMRL